MCGDQRTTLRKDYLTQYEQAQESTVEQSENELKQKGGNATYCKWERLFFFLQFSVFLVRGSLGFCIGKYLHTSSKSMRSCLRCRPGTCTPIIPFSLFFLLRPIASWTLHFPRHVVLCSCQVYAMTDNERNSRAMCGRAGALLNDLALRRRRRLHRAKLSHVHPLFGPTPKNRP